MNTHLERKLCALATCLVLLSCTRRTTPGLELSESREVFIFIQSDSGRVKLHTGHHNIRLRMKNVNVYVMDSIPEKIFP